jgi:hypothetical protein
MSNTNRFPILGALDAEWGDFIHSPAAADAVERWRRHDPVLAELETVEDVLALRRDEVRADLVLRALVDRAPTDPVAARVVLQSILPGLVRIACWYADDDPEGAASEIMAIAWERICSYPAHRSGDVAPNLLLDVRKQMRFDREPLGTFAPAAPVRSAEEVVVEALLFEELRAAEVARVGAAESFDLVVASRVDGHRIVDIAAARNERPHAVEMRRKRAEQRLRQHLATAA